MSLLLALFRSSNCSGCVYIRLLEPASVTKIHQQTSLHLPDFHISSYYLHPQASTTLETLISSKQLANMHSSPSMLLAILAIALPSTLALPQYPIPCDDYPPTTSYSITSQQTNVPGPLVMADFSCGGGTAAQFSSHHANLLTDAQVHR